jgi:hypothetical protein
VVVYALPGNDESWIVGCSFAEPLDQGAYEGVIAGASQDAS